MLKKVLLVVVVLFLGYWLVQQPDSFAAFAQDGVGWAWKMAQMLFQSLIDVLDSLGH